MAEWKEYTGSDEQIEDMRNAFMCRNRYGNELASIFNGNCFVSAEHKKIFLKDNEITQYLICEPHPLADMICQQARTGQPVWIRFVAQDINKMIGYETTKPDWNIPNAEYSFTPF